MAVRILPLPSSLLLGAILVSLVLLMTERKPVSTPPPALAELAPTPLTSVPEEVPVNTMFNYLDQILARPIFEPSRQPLIAPELIPEPVIEEEPEPEVLHDPEPEPVIEVERTPPPAFELSGVLLQGTRSSALLTVETAEPVWVELDEVILEWKLRAIYPNYVELVNDGESIRLFLHPER